MVGQPKHSDPSLLGFSFFTNHAHVLFVIARESDARMRELATEVGITERAVQRIVEDLTATGYLLVTKEGRRNHYQIQSELPLRRAIEAHRNVGELIRFIYPEI
jgi:predicted transcriptional regulator